MTPSNGEGRGPPSLDRSAPSMWSNGRVRSSPETEGTRHAEVIGLPDMGRGAPDPPVRDVPANQRDVRPGSTRTEGVGAGLTSLTTRFAICPRIQMRSSSFSSGTSADQPRPTPAATTASPRPVSPSRAARRLEKLTSDLTIDGRLGIRRQDVLALWEPCAPGGELRVGLAGGAAGWWWAWC